LLSSLDDLFFRSVCVRRCCPADDSFDDNDENDTDFDDGDDDDDDSVLLYDSLLWFIGVVRCAVI
jgi:hypothetical protein